MWGAQQHWSETMRTSCQYSEQWAGRIAWGTTWGHNTRHKCNIVMYVSVRLPCT